MDEKEKTKPAYEVTIRHIRAACWANRTRDGTPWYSVTIDRVYVDDKGVRRHARSYGRDDLPVIREAAALCYRFILTAEGGFSEVVRPDPPPAVPGG